MIDAALALLKVGLVPTLQTVRPSIVARSDSMEPLESNLTEPHSGEWALKSPATTRFAGSLDWCEIECSRPLRERSYSWIELFGVQ